jgi:regulatory protein
MAESELFRVSLNKSMAQCSHKELCREDIHKKLALWGVTDDDIEKIIDILIKEKFIDETRYASAFVRDKFKYNKWGKVKIASHLKSKRIPSEIIGQALDSIDYDHYVRFLQGLLEVHKRSVKAKNQMDLKAKLLRFALSKGFESSLVYDVINEITE